jgi:hypothetical protein
MLVGPSSLGTRGAKPSSKKAHPWSFLLVPLVSLMLEEPRSEVLEAPVQEMPSANGALQGAVSVNVDGAGPQPSDYTRGSLWDLVMHGADISVSESAAPGDVAPAPRSSGAAGPWVSGLLLQGFPSFLPLPINWRRVEDDAEFTYWKAPL